MTTVTLECFSRCSFVGFKHGYFHVTVDIFRVKRDTMKSKTIRLLDVSMYSVSSEDVYSCSRNINCKVLTNFNVYTDIEIDIDVFLVSLLVTKLLS